METTAKVDHDKNRKITNGLFYSAPLAAGLGTALLSKNGATKIFSKDVAGVAGRMAKGLKVAGYWTAGLLAIDLLGNLKNKVAQNSQEVRKFDKDHPMLAFGTMLAAGIGTLALVGKGVGALSKLEAPKFLQKATSSAETFLNESKIMVGAKNAYLNLLDKTPSALKEIGATALDWAPTALLFGGLFHSVSSANAESREFAKSYTRLREQQDTITQEKIAELSLENDLMKQDPENEKEMDLLNDSIANAEAEEV
jgi:hypothetical protein